MYCSTVQYSAIYYSAVQYITVQCSTVQYWFRVPVVSVKTGPKMDKMDKMDTKPHICIGVHYWILTINAGAENTNSFHVGATTSFQFIVNSQTFIQFNEVWIRWLIIVMKS